MKARAIFLSRIRLPSVSATGALQASDCPLPTITNCNILRAGRHKGSRALADIVFKRVKPLFHVFGHEHADCGIKTVPGCPTTFINASSVSNFYHVGCRRSGHVVDIRTSPAHNRVD
jgi:Icc-related predicted phosphoesterase